MNCTVEWDSSTAGSQYLVHERQRLLHIFLLLFGQILQHLLQLLLVVFHLAFNIWNNGQHTEADILQSDPWNLWVTHLNIADCLFFSVFALAVVSFPLELRKSTADDDRSEFGRTRGQIDVEGSVCGHQGAFHQRGVVFTFCQSCRHKHTVKSVRHLQSWLQPESPRGC